MAATSAGRFALLWFVPLLTLTQAIQKVRSFAEHGPLQPASPADPSFPGTGRSPANPPADEPPLLPLK